MNTFKKSFFVFFFALLVSAFAVDMQLGSIDAYFSDSGFSSCYAPSLTVFNKKYVNINMNVNMLYLNIEDVNIKNYAAGIEYKNKKKWALSFAGAFLKISSFQDVFVSLGGSYRILPFLSAGLSYQADVMSSTYDNFSFIKHTLLFSSTYRWKFLSVTAGAAYNNFLDTGKSLSELAEITFLMKNISFKWVNQFGVEGYTPSIGVLYKLNSVLSARSQLSFNEMIFGIGADVYRDITVNYNVSIHRELGYSHLAGLQVSF